MRLALRVFCVVTLFLISFQCFGQATPGQYKPYMNLAKWYGTQSAPSKYEKALWAIDDINDYLVSVGREPISEDILKNDVRQPRVKAFRAFKLFKKR